MEPVKSSIPISGLPDNTPGSPGFYHGKLFTNSNLEQPSGLGFYSMLCDGFLLNCSDLGQHKVSLSLFCGLIPGLADSLRAPGHWGQSRCQGGHLLILVTAVWWVSGGQPGPAAHTLPPHSGLCGLRPLNICRCGPDGARSQICVAEVRRSDDVWQVPDTEVREEDWGGTRQFCHK